MAAPLSAAERQKIIELYLTKVDGRWLSGAKIAQEVGRSRSAVEHAIEQAGFTRRGTRRRVTTGERRRIVELYRTKTGNRWTSTVEIGKRLGRPASTIARVLTEAGVPLRHIGEALSLQVSDELRDRIVELYVSTGWAYPKVADTLNLPTSTVYDVLDRAQVIVRRGPNCQAKVRVSEAELVVALYRQGRSSQEVAKLTGRTVGVVRWLAYEAGVMRTRREGCALATRRRAVRAKLAKLDLRPHAQRWMDGTEVEQLAAELEAPADLMWDALAEQLSTMLPDTIGGHRADCVGSCWFACEVTCARTTPVGTGKTGRLY